MRELPKRRGQSPGRIWQKRNKGDKKSEYSCWESGMSCWPEERQIRPRSVGGARKNLFTWRVLQKKYLKRGMRYDREVKKNMIKGRQGGAHAAYEGIHANEDAGKMGKEPKQVNQKRQVSQERVGETPGWVKRANRKEEVSFVKKNRLNLGEGRTITPTGNSAHTPTEGGGRRRPISGDVGDWGRRTWEQKKKRAPPSDHPHIKKKN